MDNPKQPLWHQQIQDAAWARFETLPWPHKKDEEWRRTDLKRLDWSDFSESPAVPEEGDELRDKESFRNRPCILPLREAIRRQCPGVREALEEAAENMDNRLQALLLATTARGVYLHFPAGYKGDAPVVIPEEYKDGERKSAFRLNVIVAGEGADAEVWEQLGQNGTARPLILRGTLVYQKPDSRLKLNRTVFLQSRILDFSRARLEADALLTSFSALDANDLVKSDFKVSLNGPGAEADLKGLYWAEEKEFLELSTLQNHRAPHTNSRAFYRGIASDTARTVYNGLIRVDHSGSGTDAYLTNNNLLLSGSARADSLPRLEIETDEVRCSHGSTTGKMDEGQIFYLQSRGFSREEARRMITSAFMEEVMKDLTPAVRDEIAVHWRQVLEDAS